MTFNNEAYEEVFPRVTPVKLPPKKQSILPDEEEEIITDEGEIEVETPETEPEEEVNDDAGSSDTAD